MLLLALLAAHKMLLKLLVGPQHIFLSRQPLRRGRLSSHALRLGLDMVYGKPLG